MTYGRADVQCNMQDGIKGGPNMANSHAFVREPFEASPWITKEPQVADWF
jgi:hypothetical protein